MLDCLTGYLFAVVGILGVGNFIVEEAMVKIGLDKLLNFFLLADAGDGVDYEENLLHGLYCEAWSICCELVLAKSSLMEDLVFAMYWRTICQPM